MLFHDIVKLFHERCPENRASKTVCTTLHLRIEILLTEKLNEASEARTTLVASCLIASLTSKQRNEAVPLVQSTDI